MYSLLYLLILILDIYAIVKVLGSSLTTGMKVLWIVLILFFPVLGVLGYFLLGDKKA